MRVEEGAIWAFFIVAESERGFPLKEKKKEDGSRVWNGRRDNFKLRRVRSVFRIRARVGIWSSGD